jgi:hypothetical protein
VVSVHLVAVVIVLLHAISRAGLLYDDRCTPADRTHRYCVVHDKHTKSHTQMTKTYALFSDAYQDAPIDVTQSGAVESVHSLSCECLLNM